MGPAAGRHNAGIPRPAADRIDSIRKSGHPSAAGAPPPDFGLTPNSEASMQKHDLIAWAESRREIWLDCVRIYLGVGLFARGLLMITNTSTGYFVDMLQRSGHPWVM